MKTQVIHTEAGMLQGATIQYRNYFRTMALGGHWCVFRAEPGETLSGVIVAPIEDMPNGTILVDHVEAMTEQHMRILLSNAIRYGAHPRGRQCK
jgi:hypothetical protein